MFGRSLCLWMSSVWVSVLVEDGGVGRLPVREGESSHLSNPIPHFPDSGPSLVEQLTDKRMHFSGVPSASSSS